MPSAIDQRLASRLHQQQVETVARSEKLARQLGKIWDAFLRELIGMAGEEWPYDKLTREAEAAFSKAAGEARRWMAEWAEQQVELAHQDVVKQMLAAVPLKWFRGRDPRLLVLEDIEPTDIYEPIRRRKISRDEAMELIRSTLFPPPTADKAREYLTNPGPGGLTWEERLRRHEPAARQQILGELTQSISQAEDIRTLRKRLEPAVGGIQYKAQRIARTEGRRVAMRSQQAAFDQLGDMLDGMQILAVMDQWTRPEHAARNGKIYRRQPDGGYLDDAGQPLPDLPDEPNCRCYASPVLKPPEEFLSDPAMAAEFRNASADLIPDPSAYDKWFDQADEDRRRLAVGRRRYEAMTDLLSSTGRRPDWEDFIAVDGRLLSVQLLRGETLAERADRRRQVTEILTRREAMFRQAHGLGFVF